MPITLTNELTWEWLFDDLSETEITQLSRYQIPSKDMQVYTVRKDFKTAEGSIKLYKYEGLSTMLAK